LLLLNFVEKLLNKKSRTPIDNSENRQGKRTGKPGFLRFGTWNIRTLYKPGALQNLIQVTNSYKPDIIALQEMRWPGTGNVKSDNVTLFYSGPNNGKHENGVGFIIKDSRLNLVKKFEPINDRLCYLTITGKIFDIVLINCYAPTETADEDLKDAFYETLERIFNSIPTNSIKIVLGDMNAQVGREKNFKKTAGKESFHLHSNNNGLRLVSFATSKDLTISSTMFQRKEIHKHTWKSPDGKTMSQIDHILIDKRYKSCISQVRTFRGADGDTDHYLVMANLKTKLSRSWIRNKTKTKARPRLDTNKIKDPEIIKTYQNTISNLLYNNSSVSNQNPKDEWKEVKDALNKAR